MNAAQQATETPAPKLTYRAGYCYITCREAWMDYGSISYCKAAGPRKATIQTRGFVKGGDLFSGTGIRTENTRSPYTIEVTLAEAKVYIEARQRIFDSMGNPRHGDCPALSVMFEGLVRGLFGDRMGHVPTDGKYTG